MGLGLMASGVQDLSAAAWLSGLCSAVPATVWLPVYKLGLSRQCTTRGDYVVMLWPCCSFSVLCAWCDGVAPATTAIKHVERCDGNPWKRMAVGTASLSLKECV
jgi:hypothetical protein